VSPSRDDDWRFDENPEDSQYDVAGIGRWGKHPLAPKNETEENENMGKKKERMKSENVNIQTPEFRVSYSSVFKPAELSKKYELAAIFQVAETEKSKAAGTKIVNIDDLKTLCRNVAIEKYGADRTKWPPVGDGVGMLKFPFREGTETAKKDVDGYGPGTIFVTLSSKTQRPGIVESFKGPDGRPAPLGAESDFYDGCYARAVVNAYWWEFAGKFGISLGLQNLQKLRDGERFGGRGDASAAFEPIDAPVGQPAGAAQASNKADPTAV
jgi:hypothetical protein